VKLLSRLTGILDVPGILGECIGNCCLVLCGTLSLIITIL
jgi:hypothetical protein